MNTNKINEISIIIDKAKITSIAFDLEEDMPQISINVDLMTTSNKKVTSVLLSTKKYYGLDLNEDYVPAEIYHQIGRIVNQLAPLCVRRINSIDKLLASPEVGEL